MKVFKIVSGSILLFIFITINVIELVKINDIDRKAKEFQEFKEKQENLNKSYIEMFGSVIDFQNSQIEINKYLLGGYYN